MGLDSATVHLRQSLDKLEERQRASDYMPRMRQRTRVLSSAAIERLDSAIGRSAIRRAIEDVLPKLGAIESAELRSELEMVLAAASEHVR